MIKVKNWSKYQSYKDRKPPWIRFHRAILDDYQFQKMSADARATLPMLWLLACEDEDPTSGLVKCPLDEIAFRLRQNEKDLTVTIRELEVAEFIECIESVTKPLRERDPDVTPETETETETEQATVGQKPRPRIPYEEIVSFLNRETGKNFKSTTNGTKAHIKARFTEGFSFEDFKTVILAQNDEWRTDPKMEKYLRPSTLFGPKFESYLQASDQPQPEAWDK